MVDDPLDDARRQLPVLRDQAAQFPLVDVEDL